MLRPALQLDLVGDLFLGLAGGVSEFHHLHSFFRFDRFTQRRQTDYSSEGFRVINHQSRRGMNARRCNPST